MASFVERIEELTTQGDLVGAWRLLDAHGALHAGESGVASATARLLRLRGRHAEARELLERTLSDAPDDARVMIELAYVARDLGEREVAHDWFERAYRDSAQGEPWVLDWIELLRDLSRLDLARRLAVTYCERVPSDARGWFLFGLVCQLDKRHDLALSAYEHAMRLDPTVPMLRNNMAAAYIDTRRCDDAQALLKNVLRDEPGNALAWTNLGTALLLSGDPAAAQVAAERACALAPDYPVALSCYTNVLSELQQWDMALHVAQRAAQREPANMSHAWALAMQQLLRGDYTAGWLNHEARWDGSPELSGTSPNWSMPRWSGQSLAGRTLLVWSEQGHGDVLQFARFLPLMASNVRQAGGKLIFLCYASLLTLMRRSLGDEVETIIPHDQPLPPTGIDYHLPLASLPLTLGVMPDQLPVATSYLHADHVKVDAWRARRERETARLKVGLVWSGGRTHQRNPLRSVDPLALARALGAVQDVDFVSVQLGAADEAAAMREAGLRLSDPSGELASFDDTAALLRSLDLVITVCTSVAHLAGALGVPAWVLLDVRPHWAWMLERRDSPWYPSIRLYRQRDYGQWEPVLAQVAHDLAALAGTAPLPPAQRAGA
ncbi:tetratricopeptide repeat protein [Paraburkholderia sprentiae WSM5005]|uniref:Tetratricopeptide repeat protein n=2 Tax=Paraburkholderia sprentiae TaxID=948107 RepID=A0A1I9YSG3_9BURK|nr:tetratricopeptide repeat protein [Paraburkholderia sprentiae WSM5005]